MISPPHIKYYVIYKPFGMLSQFTKEGNRTTLAELFTFPKDVYPIGRLDAESEGLLIISNDKKLNHYLLHPTFKHERIYLAQVDGAVTDAAINQLSKGVSITVEGKICVTLPAKVQKIDSPSGIAERNPPIRVRKSIPTSWIQLSLTEGKNHQVRKMTAKVGFPTLRLIRSQIEELNIDGMKPSDVKELKQEEIFKLLKIKPTNF